MTTKKNPIKKEVAMDWLTMLKKGGLGVMTFVAAYIAANPEILTKFIPADISQLTVGGLVAAGFVMLANWLKNKGK